MQLSLPIRGSGRTTQLIDSIPEDADYIYIVAGSFHEAMAIRKAANYRLLSSRIMAIGLDSLYRLRGVDPQKIYFDHSAYERATSRQLSEIYQYEDMRDSIWNGEI